MIFDDVDSRLGQSELKLGQSELKQCEDFYLGMANTKLLVAVLQAVVRPFFFSDLATENPISLSTWEFCGFFKLHVWRFCHSSFGLLRKSAVSTFGTFIRPGQKHRYSSLFLFRYEPCIINPISLGICSINHPSLEI